MDLFKKFHKEIEYCTFCPKLCRFSCPVANASCSETYTPWGRQSLLHLVAEGKQEFNRETSLSVYHCAGCMLCREYCDHDLEIPPVMEAARTMAVEKQVEPVEVADFKLFFGEHNNPVGDNLQQRVRAILPDRYFNKDAQVIYWPGCTAIYNMPKNVTDTFDIFDAMGIDYVGCWDGDEACCAYPLATLGLMDEYEKLSKKVTELLSGYKTIISGCPTCVYMFKSRYLQEGKKLTPKVYHITEFLAPMIAEGKLPLKKTFPQACMYHDPCFMTRYLHIYDQPRQILQEVLREPLGEFSYCRDDGMCCGGGGGLPISQPGLSRQIAMDRLKEFREGKEKVLVSACPTCERHFQKWDDSLKVMDIVNILAKCI
jgi:Fe-S oxidoreductase